MKNLDALDLLIIALIFIGGCMFYAGFKGHEKLIKRIDSCECVEVDNVQP